MLRAINSDITSNQLLTYLNYHARFDYQWRCFMNIDTERELERFGLKDEQELEYSTVFLPKGKWYVDYNGERKFTYLGQGDVGKQNLEKIKEKIGIVGMFLITDSEGGIKRVEKNFRIDHLKYIVVKDMIYYVLDKYHDKETFAMIKNGYLNEKKRALMIGNEKLIVYEIEKGCSVVIQDQDFSHKHKKIEGSELKLLALTSFDQAIKIITGF